MKLYRAKIQYIRQIVSHHARPGQFYMVRSGDGLDPFLSRPFALHRVHPPGSTSGSFGDDLEILFQVVGRGTGMLARRGVGETLDVLGPLGRGWNLEANISPILGGGGIGVASLVSLAEGMDPEQRLTASVFVGAQSPERLWCIEDLEQYGLKPHTAVETGKHPFRGNVLDLLTSHWGDVATKNPKLFVCGPRGMLSAIAQWAIARGVPCQVSLESRMACGVGVCLGCAVKMADRDGYIKICHDGPVLDADQIDWGAVDARDIA
jgi:dihydroorotate dehydrogenase electron transfer subunit